MTMFSNRNKPVVHLHRFHRWFGIIAAFFALNLSITGILLNHTEALNLDSTPLKSRLLLNWYGIEETAPEEGFAVGNQWIASNEDQLFLDNQVLPYHATGPVRGAARISEVIIVLFPHDAVLFTPTGELVDVLSLPAPHQAEALAENHAGNILIRTDQAMLLLDSSLTQFKEALNLESPTWQKSQPLPPAQQNAMLERASAGIPLERVILDLHSGRLFGSLGVWIMDLAAIAIAALAVSGVFMWFRRAKRARRRAQGL